MDVYNSQQLLRRVLLHSMQARELFLSHSVLPTICLLVRCLLAVVHSPPCTMIQILFPAQERALHISTLKELTDNLQNELASLTLQVDLPQSDSVAPTIELPPLIKKLAEGASLTPQETDEALSDIEFLYNTLSTEMIHLRSLAQKNGLKLTSSTSSDSKTTITLGSSLDLSKSAKGLGIPFKTGMSLKVHEQNRAGGIHGKRAHIIFLDDAYRPALAEKNIETFLTVDHTPFILAPVGSPTLAASLDLIEQKKILVLFPQSGSLLFRKPLLTHVINFRASFQDEGRLLTEFVIEKYRSKKFVFFYQDDEFGTGVLEGAKDALKTMKNAKQQKSATKQIPRASNH